MEIARRLPGSDFFITARLKSLSTGNKMVGWISPIPSSEMANSSVDRQRWCGVKYYEYWTNKEKG